MEVDVAIVGFGAAGACAALEAARAGARTAIFERSGGPGGASALSGGEIYLGGGGGTEIQRNAGFVDATEDFETYLKASNAPYGDAEKYALYARSALDHFAWLKAMGVPYKGTYLPGKIIEPTTDDTLIWSGSEAAAPFCDLAQAAPRGHVVQHVGWGGGKLLMKVLAARVGEAGIDVRVNARATGLIADGAQVVGLVVRIDNRDVHVRAHRGVVLAAGGFCMNRTMLERYAPQALALNDPIGVVDDGAGIMLGLGAGGDAIHMDQFFTTCPWTIPEPLSQGVFVNVRGQRFINEDCYHGRVSRTAIDQPSGKVYLLVDASAFARPIDAARISLAATGETWEDVERELALPENTLAATMAFYNQHAAEGRDPLFGKRPPILRPLAEAPFAAFELDFAGSYFSFFTLGGLRTSVDGEVLDRAGAAIPGLFAAGRTTSGLPASGYGYSSGLSLADCTFFGRRAGAKAAAEAQGVIDD
jgi:succinate dehydrogenase/fumarate reductase flavoprotein subunit